MSSEISWSWCWAAWKPSCFSWKWRKRPLEWQYSLDQKGWLVCPLSSVWMYPQSLTNCHRHSANQTTNLPASGVFHKQRLYESVFVRSPVCIPGHWQLCSELLAQILAAGQKKMSLACQSFWIGAKLHSPPSISIPHQSPQHCNPNTVNDWTLMHKSIGIIQRSILALLNVPCRKRTSLVGTAGIDNDDVL